MIMAFKVHPFKLSNGIQTFNGYLIIAEQALYFLCKSKGSAIVESMAISQGFYLGDLLSDSKLNEDQLESITEADLQNLIDKLPGSQVFRASEIDKVQHNIFLRYIKCNGKKMGAPKGFSKVLREDLGPWLRKHKIKASGF